MKLGTSTTPVLAEVIREAFENRLSDLHTAMPGTIVKYDSRTQEASVQPLLKRAYINEDGSEGLDELPIIQGVQVAFPRAGKYFMTFPLAKGDPVLLVFSERSLDEWSASSGKVTLDPIDLRMHDLSDAIAIPGCYPDTKPLPDSVGSGVAIGKEKGVHIRITDGDTIEITTRGAEASVGGFVALADLVAAEIKPLYDAINLSTPGSADGGAALQTSMKTYLLGHPQSTASKNLKAD